MPIVLAIEPDRSQAAHLQAIVRHQVGAELVLAHTTEGALDAIGDRVPDLVLVPALLSPQDDAALAAALRVIAAAAHVRTLTIPVLANGVKREAAGGMLAKWRKSRAASPEPDGCEPSVFAEQISAYLKEAAAERAELEFQFLEDKPAPVHETHPTAPSCNSEFKLRVGEFKLRVGDFEFPLKTQMGRTYSGRGGRGAVDRPLGGSGGAGRRRRTVRRRARRCLHNRR